MTSADPWAAKMARAGHHLRELDRVSKAYLQSHVRLDQEITESGRELSLRLRLSELPPLEISTIAGDVLHNLRSSLDSVVYALAEAGKGSPLDSQEAEAVAFPVSARSIQKKAQFLKNHERQLLNLSAESKHVLFTLQPFYENVQAREAGVELTLDGMQSNVTWHALRQLTRLSNVDKHRRLHLAFINPDMLYYGSDGVSPPMLFSYAPQPYVNGSVVATLSAPSDNDEPMPVVQHEFVLVIQDEALPEPRRLDHTLQQISHHVEWVALPRLAQRVTAERV